MSKRHMGYWIALLALLFGAVPTAFMQEADSPWFAYLFNSSTKELVRVNELGEQQTFDLGLPADVYIGGRELSFSPDGTQAAFCMLQPQAQQQTSTNVLIVRDLALGTNLVERELGEGIACSATFDEKAERVVVSRLHEFLAGFEVDAAKPLWTLEVYSLPAADAPLAVMDRTQVATPPERGFGMALVRSFVGAEVVFAVVPYATEGPAWVPAYRWNVETGVLVDESAWGNLFYTELPAWGEIVWLEQDDSLPMGNPGGPMPSNNVVRLSGPYATNATLYHSPDWVLIDLAFIEGGRSLALQLLESFDPAQGELPQQTRWVAINRQGESRDLGVQSDYTQLIGTADGFAALVADDINGQPGTTPSIRLELHEGGEAQQLWEVNPGGPGLSWELVWSTPMTPAEDLQPFQPLES